MLGLKNLKNHSKFYALTLSFLLVISGVPIKGSKNIVHAADGSNTTNVATTNSTLNYFEQSLYPIEAFTMRTAANITGDSSSDTGTYFTLQPDNTLTASINSNAAATFELYSYGDGTSAIKCLTNGKYLSFKAYKPADQYVIKADADTVGWNERFKITTDPTTGQKSIISHFTYNRDDYNRYGYNQSVSLVTYNGQKNTLSVAAAIPAVGTSLFVFNDVQEPTLLKVYSSVSGNTAQLNWNTIPGYTDSNNYVVKDVTNGQSVQVNSMIGINNNLATISFNNLSTGKEYKFEVDLLDSNGAIISSKTTPIRIFNHPGLLHSQADLDALSDHVQNKMEPWYSDFLALQNTVPSNMSSLDFNIVARTGVGRGSPADSGNIGDFDRGGLAAYYDALQWVATGDDRYADKAVQILNAWAYTLKVVDGRDNILGAGLDGYHFANAAEIIRNYKGGYAGYKTEDFKKLQDMMINVIYPVIQDFGVPMIANGNWDGAAYVTMASIGVLCDNTEIFDRAINYYDSDNGNGSIKNYVTDSGQTQESGRDQAHAQLGIGLMAETCEVAWKQGIDLYSLENNRLLKAFEYSAKYNLFNDDVPFTAVPNVYGRTDIYSYWPDRLDEQGVNRGELRPIYELALAHYKGIMGMSCEWTEKAAEVMRPQGFEIFDNLNFGTLTQYNGAATDISKAHIFKLRTRVGTNYESTLTKLPDGSYVAETKNSYYDLQSDNTLAITTMRGAAPYFELQPAENGTYAIKCLKNNKYLSVKPNDPSNPYVIKADADTIGQNEKFNFYGNGATPYDYITFPVSGSARRASLMTINGNLTLTLNAASPAHDTDMLIPYYDSGSCQYKINTSNIKVGYYGWAADGNNTVEFTNKNIAATTSATAALFDGNTSTATGIYKDQYLYLDLGTSNVNLSKIALTMRSGGSITGNWKIYGSNTLSTTASDWAVLATPIGLSVGKTKEISVSSSYRYILMGCSDSLLNSWAHTWDQLSEIALYTTVDKVLQSITTPASITGVVNGTDKTASALGLPTKVTLATTYGNEQADVSWDVANSVYDPSIDTAQSFTVNGTVTLPKGISNTNGVSLNTVIGVEVHAFPTTIAELNPAQPDGLNNWYRNSVTFNLKETENISDILKSEYSLDGGTTWKLFTSPVNINEDGKYSISYRITDTAGKVKTIETGNLDLDLTAPTINIITPGDANYLDSQTIVVDYTLVDTLSGVNTSTITATFDGQPIANGTSMALYKLTLGQHVFTVTAADNAGNIATEKIAFTTTTSISSMKSLVQLFKNNGSIDNQGIMNSLLQKLNNNDLQSFINEVNAQDGKHITNEAALYLLRDAKYLSR